MTADPRFTRITIVSSGDELLLEQIEKQVAKLEDVVDIKILKNTASVTRELMLCKISTHVKTEDRSVFSLKDLIDNFHGKVVDQTPDSVVVEVTGNTDKLDSFLEMVGSYEILELARTGLTGLSRGADDVFLVD